MRSNLSARLATPLVALALVVAACGTDDATTETGGASTTVTEASSTTEGGSAAPSSSTTSAVGPTDVDLTALPLGDGNLSTTAASAGSVLSCSDRFPGFGAMVDGPWIGSDTYDLTAKVHVEGEVSWPSELSISVDGDVRTISTNDLPDHATGEFPIDRASEAGTYDGNPNAIAAQDVVLELPADPQVADEPTCVSMGAIGVLTSGSVFFNALDAMGRDAVAHEVQDACEGHPEVSGAYHYHALTPCIDDEGAGHSALVGYAFDGFAIYGTRGVDGETVTNADLDECHGHTHEIEWDGTVEERYHYHATWEYPYTVGCYRGTPVG